MISVLIPTFNNVCRELVEDLWHQCQKLGKPFEIIVADDGSTQMESIEANQTIEEMENCRFVRRETNVGRASIRNFLASQAQYELMLFLDSDVEVNRDGFLKHYIDVATQNPGAVIYGGVRVPYNLEAEGSNLRYIYERCLDHRNEAAQRSLNPYAHFHTANFVMPRSVWQSKRVIFDERFRNYGFEDVMFGKLLKDSGVEIVHIPNPVELVNMDTNDVYLQKVEESLRTLHTFESDLRGYSQMIKVMDRMRRFGLVPCIKLIHTLLGRVFRRNILSAHPAPFCLQMYKLGYYASLK